MQIISNTTNFQIDEPTAVVLGKFDGVHIGHQVLIERLQEQKEKGLKTVIFTFDKSPASLFIHDGDTYRELYTLEEKRRIFEALSVDVLLEFPMNMDTASIPADEFVTEILQKKLNCNMLIAGEDVTFGYRGQGDKNLLLEYQKAGAFQVEIVDKLMIREIFPEEEEGKEISSTGIRKDISSGKLAKANTLMGRAYEITGEVIHGNRIGGDVLKMPTANVKWPENKVFPAFGVYYSIVMINGKCYNAITNVGYKPTIPDSDTREVLAETYLYGFMGDLYGSQITVRFYDYVRPEQKFNSLEELKAQLGKDLKAGEAYWGNIPRF